MMQRVDLKRLFDVAGSSLALVFFLPLMFGVAIAVRIAIGSPVIFRQQRPGFNATCFTMFKFKTMSDARDSDGDLLPDAQRLTPLGRFLRSTSLDELPEFWNVLRGDMSLVGPRPLLMEYLPLYDSHEWRRHEVRPGITGWAQVNGRNALSWEDKFALDVWYVDNRSLWLDLKIIAMTLAQVFRRQGISAHGDATMPRFTGSAGRSGNG